MIDEILNPPKKDNPPKARTPQEIAEERHANRTPEREKELKKEWNARQDKMYSVPQGLTNAERTKWINYQKQLATTLGVKHGAPMTLQEADMQSANPNYKENSPYSINCQTCAPTYVLRSQGFNVIAKGKAPGSVSEWIARCHIFDIWENIDGTPAEPTLYRDWLDAKGYKTMTAKRYKAFYEEATAEPGIYITNIEWRGGGAHATIIQRFADGTLAYIEPQHFNGTIKRSIDELCNEGKTKISAWSKRGIMRVDDKMLKRVCRYGGKDYDIMSIFEPK